MLDLAVECVQRSSADTWALALASIASLAAVVAIIWIEKRPRP